MEIPTDIVEYFLDEYEAEKVALAVINGGPVDMDLRFILDFGRDFEQWPFYRRDKIIEEMGVDPEDELGDRRLLAVADIPNDREQILVYFARMMTWLGPPEWCAVLCDAYEKHISPEDIEQMARDAKRGDLERDYRENPYTDVIEVITGDACHSNGSFVAWRHRFGYDDQGQVQFNGDRERRDARRAGGYLATLLQSVVELHGKEPYDILLTLARGDPQIVEDIVKRANDDMN